MVRPTGAGDSLATGSVIPVTASRSNGQSSVTIAQSNLLCVIHLNTDLKVERYDDSSTPLDTFLQRWHKYLVCKYKYEYKHKYLVASTSTSTQVYH